MAVIYRKIRPFLPQMGENVISNFVRERFLSSWPMTLWLLFLAYVTFRYTAKQLSVAPILTGVVLFGWLLTLGMVVRGELGHRHLSVSRWMKENLYNSITNVLVTLLLVLFILATVRGFFNYAFVNASFESDPALAAAKEFSGANWGAVIANMRNLFVFSFPRDEDWRLWTSVGILAVLGGASAFVYRPGRRPDGVRRGLTIVWLLTPFLFYLLLRGVGSQTSPISPLNIDTVWGGFLLTAIISVFSIVVSFPLGIVLALGRRSKITGVPAGIIWLVAIIVTIWALRTYTPTNLASARSSSEKVLAYWPLLIPVLAYLFNHYFKGNVVAAFSVIYIECVRGVPLITVLFLATILFGLLLPPNIEILNTWRVLGGFALFSAAYLAENVRGGLQAISKGQYEAADSLGLSTFNKYRLIILPQALRAVIPAIVGQFIGLFKDTSLVSIVGMFDLLRVSQTISSQPNWLGVRTEPYIFIALIYYIICAVMAGYSLRLEKQLGVGER